MPNYSPNQIRLISPPVLIMAIVSNPIILSSTLDLTEKEKPKQNSISVIQHYSPDLFWCDSPCPCPGCRNHCHCRRHLDPARCLAHCHCPPSGRFCDSSALWRSSALGRPRPRCRRPNSGPHPRPSIRCHGLLAPAKQMQNKTDSH